MTYITYDDLPDVKNLLISNGIIAKKSLGQNFLIDLSITDRIVKQIPNIQNKIVIEIGAGVGTLTRALLKNNAKKVIAIEIDQRTIAIQNQISKYYPNKLNIVNKDALTLDHHDYMQLTGEEDFYICANLPYNISVPLLISWLYQIYFHKKISGMMLMFQKEVANRITATQDKNKSDYGRLAVLSNVICQTKQIFDIPAVCFYPKPKILSSVVSFNPIYNLDCSYFDIKKLDYIVKLLFSNRRKMIRHFIKDKNIFMKCNIDETKRAEDLSIHEFIKLSKFF